jgi:hypothetical protein
MSMAAGGGWDRVSGLAVFALVIDFPLLSSELPKGERNINSSMMACT